MNKLPQPGTLRAVTVPAITVQIHQQDWIPGFGAYAHPGSFDPNSPCHVVLNIGSFLAAVDNGDLLAAELPYAVAELIMHEVVHVMEAWANVEFSEDRVQQLLDKYSRAGGQGEQTYQEGN